MSNEQKDSKPENTTNPTGLWLVVGVAIGLGISVAQTQQSKKE